MSKPFPLAVIDMKFIRATVDVVLDRFYPGRSPSASSISNRYGHGGRPNVGPSNRIDEDVGEQVEKVRMRVVNRYCV